MEGPVLRVSGPERLGEDPPRATDDARGAPASRQVFAASTGRRVGPPADTSGPTPPTPPDLAPRVVAATSRPERPGPTGVPACIFCERPSGSAEYAWPGWLCGFLTDQLSVRSKDPGTDAAILERTRTEVDQMVNGVCGHCSQGWIQRLDNNVSPFLQSMIAGDPTLLPQVRRRLLARWAAKTAAVMECADESPIRTPRFASEYLRRIGVHPGTQVLVGKYDGDRQILTHERDLFTRVIGAEKHYLSQSSFVIGKTLIQVFSDPWRNSTPELAENAAQPLIALVPSHDLQTDWPPVIAIDDVGYDIVRHGPVDEDERTRRLRAPSDPAA
ncbi:MAG: hypothetical protein ACLPVY_16355 [Acidimicrobiia bacterium]